MEQAVRMADLRHLQSEDFLMLVNFPRPRGVVKRFVLLDWSGVHVSVLTSLVNPLARVSVFE